MTPDLTIQVGDKVRSYDFPESMHDPRRPACYVEGTVTRTVPMFGYDAYEIRIERVVFDGKESAPTHEFAYPPVNGTLTLHGRTHGVIRACEAEANANRRQVVYEGDYMTVFAEGIGHEACRLLVGRDMGTCWIDRALCREL